MIRAARRGLLALAFALPGWASAATLDEAIALTIARGEEARIAGLQRAQTDQVPFRVGAALGPRVQFGGGVTFNQVEVAFDPGALFPPEIAGLVEQLTGAPLDLGDPIVIQRKTAFDANLTLLQPLVLPSAFVQAAGVSDTVAFGRAQETATLAQIRAGVTQAYWGVLLTREAEALATRAVDNVVAHQATVAQVVAVGMAPAQASLQAELAASRATRDRETATARRKVAERAFAALTGLPETEPLSAPEPQPLAWSSVDAAVDAAIAGRPELKIAALQIEMARTQRDAQLAGWAPIIQGRFTESYSQNTGFAGRNWLWNAGIQLSWALWDGGFRLADGRDATGQLHIAEAARERLRDDTRTEVVRAWSEVERSQAALHAVEHEISLAKENLRIAELALSAGTGTFQDVEDARLGTVAAELSQAQERMSLYLAQTALRLVTGTLDAP
jgi:outer membrane protein TolC